MAATKYRVKDIIELSGRKAEIVHCYPDKYFVEFLDKQTPTSMLVTDEEIDSMRRTMTLPKGHSVAWWQPGFFDSSPSKTETKTEELIQKYVDPNTHCPKCGTEWKETYINYEPVYDCLKCNVKKEDVV